MARTPGTDLAEMTTADLAAQMDALKSDIATLTQSIAALGRAKGAEAVETARAKAKAAKSEVEDFASNAADQAEHFVRTQPNAALGIAAGIGFLVGFLASRR